MKKPIVLVFVFVTLGSTLPSSWADAISMDDIQFWTGSGDNSAAMIVHWSVPEIFNLAYTDGETTPMPSPIQDVTMVWGYRFDGTVNAEKMMLDIARADSQLYLFAGGQPGLGVAIFGIGYDLDNDGYGLAWSEGETYTSSDFSNGFLGGQPYGDADMYLPTDQDDLYWGGWYGPNWELWHESGGEGGFFIAPDSGPDIYWTGDFFTGEHGEWTFSQVGISSMKIEDGSWVGWSIAAGGLDMYALPPDEGTLAWINNKQAPALPVPEPAAIVLLGLSSLALTRKNYN